MTREQEAETMTESVKHTPGPWRVGYRNLNVVSENEKIGGDAVVCDIRGWGYLTGNGHGALGLDPQEAAAIQDANARLIAAAPELLEALRDCLNRFIEAFPAASVYEPIKRGLAAITKATGGQP